MNSVSPSARSAPSLVAGHLGKEEPIAIGDFTEWLKLAQAQRVIPLLYALTTEAGSGFSVAERQTTRTAQIDVMAAAVHLEHYLIQVTAHLAEVGVTSPSSRAAQRLISTTRIRPCGSTAKRRPARRASRLRSRPFTPRRSGLAPAGAVPPRHHDRFTHAITFRRTPRVEVDLHQHIAHRALGQLIPTHELLADSVQYEIAGRQLRALSRPDRLIHAAIHAVSSRGAYHPLSTTADVLLLAEALER